MAENGKPNRK